MCVFGVILETLCSCVPCFCHVGFCSFSVSQQFGYEEHLWSHVGHKLGI